MVLICYCCLKNFPLLITRVLSKCALTSIENPFNFIDRMFRLLTVPKPVCTSVSAATQIRDRHRKCVMGLTLKQSILPLTVPGGSVSSCTAALLT
jgi:hypothetical protein